MTWADGSNNVFDLQRGQRARSRSCAVDPWRQWKLAYAYAVDRPGRRQRHGALLYARPPTVQPGRARAWNARPSQALPGDRDGAVVYFWMNEGIEVPFAGVVEAGANSATSIVASEDAATPHEHHAVLLGLRQAG